jgi:hypothetical protein
MTWPLISRVTVHVGGSEPLGTAGIHGAPMATDSTPLAVPGSIAPRPAPLPAAPLIAKGGPSGGDPEPLAAR